MKKPIEFEELGGYKFELIENADETKALVLKKIRDYHRAKAAFFMASLEPLTDVALPNEYDLCWEIREKPHKAKR